MNDILIKLFNNSLMRLLLGLIIGGMIASPFIDSFSKNPTWLVVGVLFFGFTVLSLIYQLNFSTKDLWSIYLIIAFTIALTTYLYFNYGR